MSNKTRREGHAITPPNQLIRVTSQQYAQRLNRTERRVQQLCKQIEQNPQATIDGHKIERYGSRYVIVLTQQEWEDFLPKPKRKEYDLSEINQRRRENYQREREERLRILAEQTRRSETKKQAYIESWSRFCLTPIQETWGSFERREVCELLAKFLGEIALIEVPRSKRMSQFYAPRFEDNEALGRVLYLESDQKFNYQRMPAKFIIPINLICNNFWIWRGCLAYFEGLNPDNTPKNPRLCSFERYPNPENEDLRV